ncbi:solute carrier family 35 member SLC35F1/F2/F6 [Scleroderma yunnanense]
MSDSEKNGTVKQEDFSLNSVPAHSSTLEDHSHLPSRPSISFDSPFAFFRSLSLRFVSLWSRSFALAFLYGQLLSSGLTVMSVITTELVKHDWVLPSTQTFFPYVILCSVYTPYTIYKYGFIGWCKLIIRDGWKYFCLILLDFEGGFLYVKAFGYTDLLSCSLLDAWNIPVCMFVCYMLIGVRYHWTQILGALICIGGLGLLVASDVATNKNGEAPRRAEGDGFMIAAATLYGTANALEEVFVRKSPIYEVLGQMGMWGMIVSATQASILEHKKWMSTTWDSTTIGLLVGYSISVPVGYSMQMVLFRLASSPYFNLSLLTSDFYSLLFGLVLFHYRPYWLYFIAFVIVITGLVVYFCHAKLEEQGNNDIKRPHYIANDQSNDEMKA